MSANINQYIKLKDIVLSYIEESKQNDSAFLRLWRLAFRAFKQMGLNSFWAVETVQINLNPNKTATLPDDYINWVSVGLFNDKGEFTILNVNQDLTTYKDLSPNRLSDIASQVGSTLSDLLASDLIDDNNILGDGNGYPYPIFGAGSKLLTSGDCRVDNVNRVILLDPNFPYSTVVLEYLSSPQQNDDYQIPMQFEEAMISYLRWMDRYSVPATSKGMASQNQAYASQFAFQLKLAKKMFKPVRLQELNLQARLAQRYAVKG